MHSADLRERLALGAAAGFAASVLLQVLRTASQWWLPATMPPFRQDPGEFMVEQAEMILPEGSCERVPTLAETAGAKTLAVGYGLTPGALYAALRPNGGTPLVDGAIFGLAVWAVGYLGWLPASGLLPPVNRQGLAVAAGESARHALFGVAAVAAYRWLRRRVSAD